MDEGASEEDSGERVRLNTKCLLPVALLMLLKLSRHPLTFLTPWRHLQDRNVLSYVLSWMRFSAPTLSMSRMSLSGGMKSAQDTPASRAWLLTTLPFQVDIFTQFLTRTHIIGPATSIDVERIISRGRLLLSQVRNKLSTQTTRAVLCLGEWSFMGMVKDEDVMKVALMNDEEGDEEVEFEDGWDSINN